MTNAAPTSILLSNTAIAARAGGRLIGTLSGTDPEGDALTFSVTDARFIVVDNNLYTTALFDLGNAPLPSLNLAITATDPGGLFLTTNFNLTVAPSALLRDVVLGGAPAGTGNLSMVPASFPNVEGSTLADSLSYAVQAVGAAGSQGGLGSEGGAGGVGGEGLAVAGLIDGLGFDLRQAGSDTLTLLAKAQGGFGGRGGNGGDGSWGLDGQDGDIFYDFETGEWDVRSFPEPGGDGGDGGRGGDGGNGGGATASILNTTISLVHGAVTLKAEATGGNAGWGGMGGMGGSGGMGGFGEGPVDDAPWGSDGNWGAGRVRR